MPLKPYRPVAPAEVKADASLTMALARTIWSEARPAAGSLVESYLSSRGLVLPPDAPIRFHPACPRGGERLPAMLALMSGQQSGGPVGVHRTFLRPDGAGKANGVAKMMTGNAGIVRLVPDAEVSTGLGLAEGIETALSVMQGYGWRPVWAATSAGIIRTIPVLPGIEHLTIFADADSAGMAAANECAARWAEAGCAAEIITAPPGQDFNDTLRRQAA